MQMLISAVFQDSFICFSDRNISSCMIGKYTFSGRKLDNARNVIDFFNGKKGKCRFGVSAI